MKVKKNGTELKTINAVRVGSIFLLIFYLIILPAFLSALPKCEWDCTSLTKSDCYRDAVSLDMVCDDCGEVCNSFEKFGVTIIALVMFGVSLGACYLTFIYQGDDSK